MAYSFIRFRAPGESGTRAGLVSGHHVLPLEQRIDDVVAGWRDIEARCDALAADAGGHGWLNYDDVEVLAPVEPRQVIQAGANYRTHVIDLSLAHRPADDPRSEEQIAEETAAMMDKRAAEGLAYFFIGLPTAIASAADELVLPGYSRKHDWELELAAVIGTEAFRLSPEEALDHVFGYTMVNDITTRDLVFRKDMPEIGTDWYRAKNAPGFLPTGPLLLPAKFVDDPQDLKVTLKLNGETMQDESTSDMIFTVAQLVSQASQNMPLLPGDLVLTGSPAGNGAHWGRLLRDGDVMEGSISGLGTQIVRCRDEGTS
ncbi:fumarylacetoacetate hydrolase family protein [Arthrobacter castelli]|uniref:fumarylacetoacetate hydrolase family protein n=1 Tax=Arthrobacter castelli TaxID=271431 RepID=UPI0003F9FE0E|nr:fumarylacetoacetate hydrolase family protein [Arthrobacter castelli]